MSEKYIELRQAIFSDLRDRGRPIAVSIGDVLEWLDEHPDQAPGRTITESELDGKRRLYGEGWSTGFLQAGGEIIPDPEPTNAEKWETFIRGTHFNVRGWTGFDATKQFAEILDKQGVKAPGGDDD